MNRESLISTIKEELNRIVDANEKSRTTELRKTLSELLTEDSGTVDSCFKIRQLLIAEDDLRKTKNNYFQWPKAVEFITRYVEKSFDKFYYEFDYEIRDTYSFWIIINDRKGLCIELDKCGCREFDGGVDPEETPASSCEFRWGIIDRKRVKYIDKFSADVCATIGDYLSIDRMLNTLTRECSGIKLKK